MYKIKFRNFTISISGALLPLIIIFYYSNYLGEYLEIFFYILLHELSHALAALAFNKQISHATITPGGVNIFVEKNPYEKVNKAKEILILLAGPLMNLVLGVIFQIRGNDLYAEANFSLSIFNLLPVKPLDGYNIIYYLINANEDDRKNAKRVLDVVSVATLLFLISIIIYGFIIGNGSIISLISCLFVLNIRRNNVDKKVSGVKKVLTSSGPDLSDNKYIKGDIITVSSTGKIVHVMSALSQSGRGSRNKNYKYIYVIDNKQRLQGILTEKEILNAIMSNKGEMSFGELLKRRGAGNLA